MPDQFQVINIPGVGKVRFPSSMSDEDVTKAVSSLHKESLRVPQPSLGAALSGPHQASDAGYTGPTTFAGGFFKSLKDQVMGQTVENPMLQSAAHPKTTGDFLSLILPSEIGEGYPAATRLKDSIKSGMAEAKPGILNKLRGAFTGARDRWDAAGMSDKDLISRNVNDMPLSKQMDLQGMAQKDAPLPAGRVQTPPTQTQNFNDLPLHQQMEHFPETAALPERTSAPPFQTQGGRPLGQEEPPAPPQMRPAGTKAPTVEEAIMSALEDAGGGEKPTLSTVAPEATTAGEGATKQSGKFGKSGNLGQARGYSSGRPSTQPASSIEQGLQDELGGRASDVTSEAVAVPASGEPPASASASHSTGRVQEYISGGQSIDPKELAPDDWARLRQQFGAKKLSQMTGVPADEIRTKLAPGPSRTPIEAQERIDDFNAQQAQERDR